MKWQIIVSAILMLSIWGLKHSLAEDSHKHGKDEHKEEESHKHEEGDEHKDEKSAHTENEDKHKHGKKDEHGHDEEEKHAHDEGEDKHAHDEKDEHGHDDEEKHAHGEGEEEEEENSSVGPDKGITAKNSNGMQLAPEAIATFGLKTVSYTGNLLKLSKDSVVKIKDEKSVYRVRDGWYKRVPIRILQKDGATITVNSENLKSGDGVVSHGVGFLRIAEIAAEGGNAHGHSH